MVKNSENQDIDRLAEEFKLLVRKNTSMTVAEFAAKNPDNSDQILTLFPAIESMERLRFAAMSESMGTDSKPISNIKQLGDFRVIKELGRGGMGIVFLAEQISLGRLIALKVLPPGFESCSKYAKRFEREARIAAGLHHTNIVPVFGVGRDDDTLYIAMQFIDGVGLNQVIAAAQSKDAKSICELELADLFPVFSEEFRNIANESIAKPFDDDLSRCIAQIGWQAATALQFAHSQGVLHRDITPGNLLLDRSGKIWVADFGLASASDLENITDTGAVMGTVNYVAPEQYYREGDERSDIYSLGMTLYELAVLNRARNAGEFLKRAAEAKPPRAAKPLRKFNPSIHRDLDAIIAKAIESDPEQRYLDATQLIADLECFLNNEPLKTRRPSIVETVMRWNRRNPIAVAASALAISLMLLITVLSTYGYVREMKHREQTEALTQIATEALSEIYAQLAPRNLPQNMPAIRSGRSPVSSFDVVQMPSDESLAVLEKLQDHYEKVCELSYDDSIKLQAADAKNRIGQIHIHLGKLAAAEHAFQDAARMCDEIIKTSSNETVEIVEEARILLASTWNQLGYVYRGQFNDALAYKAHNQAFDYLKKPVTSANCRLLYRFELARTLYSQDVYAPDDSGASASSGNILQALEILNKLESSEDPEVQLLQARCYRRLSEKHSSLPNENDDQSLRIMRKLVKQFPNISQYRFELGYTLIGDQFTKVDGPYTYFSRVDEALTIATELTQQYPDVPSYTQLAVLANEKFAHYWQVSDDAKAAAGFSETAIKLQKGLLRKFPQLVPQNRVFLYALRLENTNLMIEQGDFDRAHDELLEITSTVEELVAEPKLQNDWHALRVLTASLDSLARVCQKTGRNRMAKLSRDKADQYRKRFYRLSG